MAARRNTRTRSKRPAPRARVRLVVDERRAQLVAVGLETFSARRYDDVSIDEIANTLGVSKGLLYHYFPTKRDFYIAAIEEASRRMLADTLPPESLPPLERLYAGLEAYLVHVERYGPGYADLLRGGAVAHPKVAKLVEEMRAKFLERLLGGLGDPKPSPAVRVALRGWVGFVEAATVEWVIDRKLSRQEVRELLASVAVYAVTPHRAALSP